MTHSKRANGEETKAAGSLDELWKLVDGIETAMLTTRREDGHLVSRPMATQKRASGGSVASHFVAIATTAGAARDSFSSPTVRSRCSRSK